MSGPVTVTPGVPRERGIEAARLIPTHASCALIDWPIPPEDCETALLPETARTLARALAACGHVAFRADDPDPAFLHYQPPSPSPGGRLLEEVRGLFGAGTDRPGLAVAATPEGVARLFDFGGWSYAVQAAIVFDPAADPAPILAALGDSLDWRARPLSAPARLLFGPGHDGAFAVVAAADPTWIERFQAALA